LDKKGHVLGWIEDRQLVRKEPFFLLFSSPNEPAITTKCADDAA